MKFSEMPYVRPDPEKIKKQTAEYTEKLKNAQSYEEARAVFLAYQEEYKREDTMITVSALNTRETSRLDAPMARRMPISFVRSSTLI